MRGKAHPDGRPAVELIETPIQLITVVDQSTRAPQQAESSTGATSICPYSVAKHTDY